MKNIFYPILLLISAPIFLHAQVFVSGNSLTIKAGAILYSKGDVTLAAASHLYNEGTLITTGDITNAGTSIMQGSGQYTLQGNWLNAASFNAGDSAVTFTGSNNSLVASGGDFFYEIALTKTSAGLLLEDEMVVSHHLDFNSDDNRISITEHDLTFGASATVTNFDNNNYIVTGGTGSMKKLNLGTSEFVFPVGFDATTYNPLTIVQSGLGVVDDIGVRVLQNVLADGGSGIELTEGVADASWEVTEAIVGGSDLTLTAQWAGSDELSGFDRDESGISYYDGTGWDLTNEEAGMAAGSDPYTHIRIGVSELGYFAVGSAEVMTYVAVALEALMQGPFLSSNNLMNDNLRTIFQAPPNETLRLIPLTEPYSALSNFTHVGRGGGETVDPSVFTNSVDINNDIVDWVFLELRDKITSSLVLQTRAALIQRDGNIVDLDGISEVRFVGISGDDYYLAVRHRNHLGVRTPGTLTLSRTATAHDFTASLSQAWNNTNNSANDAMVDLGGGTTFGLFMADINANGIINITDFFISRSVSTPNQNSVYVDSDVNLNGNVNITDYFITRIQSTPNKIAHLN